MILNKEIRNKKAFTLIELLAVIVILGIIMLIAIPGVTGYITASRKNSLLTTIEEYIRIANTEINNATYSFFEPNRIYAIPIECLPIEKGGEDPFGEWLQANSDYWAYVLAEYNPSDNTFTFGFTFRDSADNGLYPTERNQIEADKVKDSYDDLVKPYTGKAVEFMPSDKWEGFTINDDTELIVLESGSKGNGKTTCTLCQKGSNYDELQNPETVSFAEDSWETIIQAVRVGKTENYHVGDTKQIDMGTFGTHTVRIANMSTPSECSSKGFSQTACGFVIEFADIITTHNMNSVIEGYPYGFNKGGWPASEMRAYVNGTIYNSLPYELRSGIINTYVVSNKSLTDTTNFISTDKIFLLSSTEIYLNVSHDSSILYTRQLDFYMDIGELNIDYPKIVKKYNNVSDQWWLRSINESLNTNFTFVTPTGSRNNHNSFYSSGVSPAFRIG